MTGQTIRQEKAPEGFENVVMALKDQYPDDPERAFAIAWGMKNRGIEPKKENGKPYDPYALHRRYQFECGQQEANSVAALGQVTRKGLRHTKLIQAQESAKLHATNLTWFSAFRETDKPEGGTGKAQVVLISAGPGNKQDGNFYPPEVIQRDHKVFESVKCFLNHPGTLEEQNRPEREVEIIGGWFSNAQATQYKNSIAAVAELHYMQLTDGTLTESGEKTRGLCESAVVYQRQYPDSVLVGFSINAEGPSHPESSEMLAQKYSQFAEELSARDQWNVVDAIESAMSVDLVTFPARGGKVLGLTEAQAFMESERWRASFRQSLRSAA